MGLIYLFFKIISRLSHWLPNYPATCMDLFAYCEISLKPKSLLLTWIFRVFMARIWGHIYNTVHIISVNPYNNSYKTNEISFLPECFIDALILLLSALGASFGGCVKRSCPAPINVVADGTRLMLYFIASYCSNFVAIRITLLWFHPCIF